MRGAPNSNLGSTQQESILHNMFHIYNDLQFPLHASKMPDLGDEEGEEMTMMNKLTKKVNAIHFTCCIFYCNFFSAQSTLKDKEEGKETDKTLSKWHDRSGLHYLWQAHAASVIIHIAILILYILKLSKVIFDKSSSKIKKVTWATSSWECENRTSMENWQICPDDPQHWNEYELSEVAACLLLLATFATLSNHLWLAIKAYKLWKEAAEQGLEKNEKLSLFLHCGIKYEYWFEYIISAPPITCVVYYFSGVIEIRCLLTVFIAQSCLMAIGAGIDVTRAHLFDLGYSNTVTGSGKIFPHKERAHHWIIAVLFVIGFLNFAVVWVPIFVELFEHYSELQSRNMEWIIALVAIEFMLFLLFGLVQLWYTCALLYKIKKKLTSYFDYSICYLFYEEHWWHLGLSFASKATLAILYLYYI